MFVKNRLFLLPSPVVRSALFSLFYANFTNIPSYLLPLTLSCGFILNPLRMLSFQFLLWPLCCFRTQVNSFSKYISCFNCFPVAGRWRCLTNGIPLWSKNFLCTTRTLQTTCELSEGLRYRLSWLLSGYLRRIRVLAMLDSVFYKCRLLQLHCAVQILKAYTNLAAFWDSMVLKFLVIIMNFSYLRALVCNF